MKRLLLLLAGTLAVVVSACGGPSASSAPTEGVIASPGRADASWYFSIEEVGLGPQGYVTLRNFTDQPGSLGDVYLCQASGCVHLPDVVVKAGDIARIAVGGGSGLANVVMTGAKLDLSPADGEVGVYGADRPRDKAAIRAYIQWGKTPHELTGVADDAGVWRKAGWAPSGPNATRLWKTDAGLWVWDPGVG